MFLSINEYDDREQVSLGGLSNSQIQGFRPTTFLQHNYPTHVYKEEELARYVDVMQEFEANVYYSRDFKYSQDEVMLISSICDSVAELTEKRFARKIKPWIAPLAALKLFRVITSIWGYFKKKQMSVFEIGPGSGYLGALLIACGFRYYAMDNTQAFYLWQNRLYNSLNNKEVIELAFDGDKITEGKIIHIPWWKYCKLYEKEALNADIVCCDRALGEISKTALKYILKISRQMLKNSPVQMFVFSSIGLSQISTLNEIHSAFLEEGYKLINYYKDFFAYALQGSDLAKKFDIAEDTLIHSNFKRAINKVKKTVRRRKLFYRKIGEDISFYNPSGSPKTYHAHDFMDLSWETSPRDYRFISYLDYGVPRANSQ